MFLLHRFPLLGCVCLLAGVASAQTAGPPTSQAPSQRPGNILLIIIDDIGPDMIGVYGTGTDLPPTPTFDGLAAGGVLFRNMYSNPAGSVTMATVETGRVGELTGVGYTIYSWAPDATLPLSEVILPEMLDLGTGGRYKTALFGKWFLGMTPEVGGDLAPVVMGYDHFEGVMEQLYFGGKDYFDYDWNDNGVFTHSTEYATTKTVNEALDWMESTPEPWFCHIDFHCAHTPYHIPPDGLYTVTLPPTFEPHGDPRPYYKADVEALDTEIGRLLASLTPELRARTTVILTADNGTPKGVVAPPFLPEHGKSTVFEGGIHVPMIVNGYAVREPGRKVAALAQTTDIFATIADLAGVDIDAILPGLLHQSISFYPHLVDPAAPALRDKVFAELFHPNGLGITEFNNQDYAARDVRYKLIRRQVIPLSSIMVEYFFDLQSDPLELNDLLLGGPLGPEAQASYDDLSAYIDAMIAL